MAKYIIKPVRDFKSAMNLVSSPDNLREDEVVYAENVRFAPSGGWTRRGGIEVYKTLTSINRVEEIIEFSYISGGAQTTKLLAFGEGKLVDVDTDSIIKSGLGTVMDYEPWLNKLYVLSGGEFFWYDGTTTGDVTDGGVTGSVIADIKKCTLLSKKGDRLFAGGYEDDPTALFYSERLEPGKWLDATGGGVNPIRAVTDDGDPITAMIEYRGNLLVFKQESIFKWSGVDPTSDVTFDRLAVESGTLSRKTVRQVGNYLFYAGKSGVYGLFGVYEQILSSVMTSRAIRPHYLTSVARSDEIESNYHHAVYLHGMYMLFYPQTANEITNKKCTGGLMFDFDNWVSEEKNDPWTYITGWDILCSHKLTNGTVLFGSANDGRIFKYDEALKNDLGLGIMSRVELAPLDGGDPIRRKKFRKGYLWAKQFEGESTILNVDVRVDYKEKTVELTTDESAVWDEGNWDEVFWDFTEIVTRRFDIGEKGIRLFVSIWDNTPDTNFEVYGVGYEAKLKKPDRR